MRKKYLSALLFGALLLASAGTFTSCKDYDDDIKNLQEQINTVKTSLDELTTKVNSLGAGVKEFKYENGKLILVTDKDTNFEVELPACEGITNLEIKNGILYADGVEVGPIGGEGTTIEGDKVEVKDGILYINGEAQDLKDEVGNKVAVTDNGSTYILTVDGTSYVLPKASAGLTSLKFENEDKTNFIGKELVNGTYEYGISWNVAATDVPNWKGKKGAVKRNQLLVGQISTVNVQVTPASFDLGSMELSLQDSKGNVAPVKVTAVKNDLLLTRSANSGSWTVSIEMTDDVTVDNVVKVFDSKYSNPQTGNPGDMQDENILYALCVDGQPVSNYDIEILTKAQPANPTAGAWNHGSKFTGFEFVDEEGYKTSIVKGQNDELPMGTTVLTPKFQGESLNDLYDSYIVFEGTNISLANSKGIVADGMTITAPASAAGTTITATVYFLDITGKESKTTITFTVAASTAESIAATPVDYKVMPATVVANTNIKLADIEVKDLTSVFAKIDAATLEKAKTSGKLSIIEEKDQTGFFIASNDGTFDPTQYAFYKADGKSWNVAIDDLTELASIKFDMNAGYNKVAKDAKPGTYNLYFVVRDENNENEIIRVKMEVKVSVPAFTELFAQRNWVDGKYVARIGAKDNTFYNWGNDDAVINLSSAYKAVEGTKADPSQLAFAFEALSDDDAKKYPVTNLDWAYNWDQLNAISGNAGQAILNKNVMYSEDGKSLAKSEISNMVAFTSVLAGLQAGQVETTQGLNTNDAIKVIQEQFTVSSDAYTTKVVAALDGVKPVYYVNGALQASDYVITLGDDSNITPLSFKDNKPVTGFGLALNESIISAKYTNSGAAEFGAEKALDGYKVEVDAVASMISKPVTDVSLIANISEGKIKWGGASLDFAKGFVVTDLTVNKAATVSFIMTDATGIEYPMSIEVIKK